ncbi:hypothetical protein IJT10_02895 [bacterium]|nr:hypothetical protein [bacterium]
MNEENYEGPGLLNILFVYSLVGVIMVFTLYIVWALLGGIDAQILLMQSPKLEAAYLKIINSGVAREKLFLQVIELMAPHIHWFNLAFISSILVFPFLGWLFGRLSNWEPNWAGLLPILGLFTGVNPAHLNGGDYVKLFSIDLQFILIITQIVCIQLFAWITYMNKIRKNKDGATTP